MSMISKQSRFPRRAGAGNVASLVSSIFVSVWKRSYGVSPAIPNWKTLQSYDSFNSWPGRLTRYSLLWAMYENSAYDSNAHSFANSYKEDKGLYKYTRGVVNPVHRLVEMWATMVWCGNLDVEAGDGKSEPTAIPLITKNPDVRPAVAKLFSDSKWNANKNMVPRLGAALGDVGIKICDDVDRERTTLDVIHPGSIPWVRKDKHGNVKAYMIEEFRIDPDGQSDNSEPAGNDGNPFRVCTYTEYCFRDTNGQVVMRTYRDGELYDWDGNGAERYFDYGFVPLVLIHHKRVGPRDQWGWSEPHGGLTKFHESDDLGSKLDDQIRKVVEGAWFITNAQAPKRDKARTADSSPERDTDNIEPSRQAMKIIYGGNGGTAVPLLFPLDIQFTTLHLAWLSEVFEKDYPELQFDSKRVSGDASAKALRESKKKAVTKFQDGRVPYDDGLVRAIQMALAISGWRGYQGFEKFNLDSYKSGKLDMRIGSRPVFEVDTLDRLEEQQAFWTAAQTAVLAGCPLSVFLAENGWTDTKIQDYMSARTAEDERTMKLDPPKVPAPSGGTGKDNPRPKNPQTAQTDT